MLIKNPQKFEDFLLAIDEWIRLETEFVADAEDV